MYAMTRRDIHILRRLWHCLGALVIVYLHSVIDENLAPIIVLMALIAFALSDINRIYYGARFPVGALLRTEEKGRISGSLWFMLGVFIAYFAFTPDIFELVILYLGFADPIAAIVGIKLGNGIVKSIPGTSASIITCTIITMLRGESISVSIIYGFVGGFSELLDLTGIDDNVCIPVFSGVLITLISH